MTNSEQHNCETKDGVPFLIRVATVDDAEPLLDCVRHAARSTGEISMMEEDFPGTVSEEREFLQSEIDDPHCIRFVAVAEGSIVGTLDFRGQRFFRVAHTDVLGMLVAKEWRDRGVGRLLLQRLISWVTTNQPTIKKVCLSVFSSNHAARALYEKLGFEIEGIRKRQFRRSTTEYVDEILMGIWVK